NYYECLDQKDMLWWHDEANKLKASQHNPMNARILGYLSLACYSLSNNALKSNDLAKAEKYLAVYSFVDPDNVDQAYLQACYYSRRGNAVGAIQSLRNAIALGFNDKAKVTND